MGHITHHMVSFKHAARSIRSHLHRKKYEISKEEIGGGSHSKVFLGHVRRDRAHSLAVKTISPATSSASLKQSQKWTENEIKALQAVRKSSHCPQLVDVLSFSNKTLILTELANGKGLHKYMETNPSGLPVDTVKTIFRHLLAGVQEIHQAGYCHLDLKLENIVYDEVTQSLTIIDFGFAEKVMMANHTERLITKYCGSIPYTSPEIGAHVAFYGTKADVWATGVILYVLLTGCFPFPVQSNDTREMLRAIQRGIVSYQDWFPEELKSLFSQLFEANPSSRCSISTL